MQLLTTKAALSEFVQNCRVQGRSIGFVPTMGALHQGHISLIQAAAAENAVTLCSIFVNAAQFNNPQDLQKYPRSPQTDIAQLEAAGCSALWMPEAREVYPHQPATGFSFGAVEQVMEGAHRPGHFSGVGLVLSKFFNLTGPCSVYMGLKDLQQFLIVKQLIADLDFDIRLVGCPTVREADGLAMSSRNVRLTAEHRAQAAVLRQSLSTAAAFYAAFGAEAAQRAGRELIADQSQGITEYFEVASLPDLQPVSQPEAGQRVAVCLAVFFGEIRLIDNLILQITEGPEGFTATEIREVR